MESKPNSLVLLGAATLIGGTMAAIITWLFGIEISTMERFSRFPDGWTTLELILNATAGLLLVGSIRAVYVALRAHYYGDSSDQPPNPGAGNW